MARTDLHRVLVPVTTADPGPAVRTVAVLVALGALAFAGVNVTFEATGRFADGPYAEYAAGIAVMNWLVVGLKVVGAAVALLSVVRHQHWVSPTMLTALVWGGFATLGVYALGGVAEAVGMAAGLVGDSSRIDLAGIGYLAGFLVAAVGYGVLAISYTRRHGTWGRAVVLGVLGAPMLLALLLLLVPAGLAALGVMPSV